MLRSLFRRLRPAQRDSVRQILGAIAPPRLRLLARIYGTDKEWRHGYIRHYQKHLPWRRRARLTILEIGVGGGQYSDRGGASLRLWRRYFPKARICGLDLYDKHIPLSRIITYKGNQADRQFLIELIEEIGRPDLVIDDGSHRPEDAVASFSTLFPRLRPGGLYVIEDLHTSYSADFGGGPPGTEGTVFDLLRELMDGLHRRHFANLKEYAHWEGLRVSALHVYDGIAFVVKSPEAGTMADSESSPLP